MFKKIAFAVALSATPFAFAPAAAANLIINGDFSAGCTGWTVSSNFYNCSGAYGEGATYDSGVLSQTFAATAGTQLVLSFDFASNSGYQFVRFNGADVAGSFIAAPTALTTYNFNLGPALASNTLAFFGRNNPSYNYLDNVSVIAGNVPEPSAWALLILGMASVGAAMRRRRQPARMNFA